MAPVLVLTVIPTVALSGCLIWTATASSRRALRKANQPLRLLVKEGDEILWRTVRGRLLVGYADMREEVVAGVWGKLAGSGKDSCGEEWSVILTAQGKLVVYRVGDQKQDDRKLGTIQICASWPELEAVLPPAIFKQAATAAGITKPAQYRELPLDA
jgi:hypothetical protein